MLKGIILAGQRWCGAWTPRFLLPRRGLLDGYTVLTVILRLTGVGLNQSARTKAEIYANLNMWVSEPKVHHNLQQKSHLLTHGLQFISVTALELKGLLIIVSEAMDPHDWKLCSCYCGDGVLCIAIPSTVLVSTVTFGQELSGGRPGMDRNNKGKGAHEGKEFGKLSKYRVEAQERLIKNLTKQNLLPKSCGFNLLVNLAVHSLNARISEQILTQVLNLNFKF